MRGERWVGCMGITCSSDETSLFKSLFLRAMLCFAGRDRGNMNDATNDYDWRSLLRSYGWGW